MGESLQILAFIGYGAGIALQTWLIIKYLIDRMDTRITEERKERNNIEEILRAEMNAVKETHVKRDDFHRHVDNVEKQIGNVGITIQNLQMGVNQRLDSIMTMLMKQLHSEFRKDNNQ